ncbi:MAG: nucleotidyl transferase AbiEii/AbiGii toxin family protein [Candidatus Hydrogenedentes bacterium]|nr:nucleotidyl transferase AbiEii/AbiGii toxin family protein [Candidatus Hydrogenedentota bacterium]
MPLTPFQAGVVRLLAANRSPDSYLAGGSALHFEPQTKRMSNDLDFFHDSEERVAQAFAADAATLAAQGYRVTTELSQPGYVRASVSKGEDITKIEWARDSSWRFMPAQRNEAAGYILHPVDLATNKVLALAGRDEARDFLDVLYAHEEILPLGALIWAACGKDPGFTPHSLLELLKRRGKYRPEDFSRLHLALPVDIVTVKRQWREALEDAEDFVNSRPQDEIGCLYFAPDRGVFVAPRGGEKEKIMPHHGRPGGVLPRLKG